MFTLKDKIVLWFIALILIALMLLVQSSPSDDEKLCKEFCAERGSGVRLHQDGVCVCQK